MSFILNALGVPLYESDTPVNHYSATNAGPELHGSSDADAMWGDASADVTMYGGRGWDTYYLYSATNIPVEKASQGRDTIITWMSYVLPTNFENLTVTGDGQSATGNSAANIIKGGDGAQTLDGGKGDDVLEGGAGADLFVVTAGNGSDLITDFTAEDSIRIEGYGIHAYADLVAQMTETEAGVQVDLGNGEILVFAGITIDQLAESQFTLDPPPEDEGGGGETPDDGTGDPPPEEPEPVVNSVLNAKGAKLYFSDAPVNHFSATDAGPELFGSSEADAMWGDASAEVTMYGGRGWDTYYLYAPGNVAVEKASQGRDTVVTWMSYALPANIENLTVTGDGQTATGNSAANIIRGGNGSQTIDGGKGDDVLEGRAGADRFLIFAGNGSDLIVDFTTEDSIRIEGYGIASFADLLTLMTETEAGVRAEFGNGEILVFAGVTIDALEESQFVISDAPENAVLNAKDVPLFYSGESTNFFSASEGITELAGSAGNDSMWGDANIAVTMSGGTGDDIYYLYSEINHASEAAGEGTDTINTWMSHVLADGFENLEVTGDGSFAFGNDADNIITGGAGTQTLDGGAGDDVLEGGEGADIFSVRAGNGSDLILDFSAEDTVRLTGYGISSFDELLAGMIQDGDDVRIDLGGGEALVLSDTAIGDLAASQFALELDRTGLQLTFADDFQTLDVWDGSSGTWDTNFWWGDESGSTLERNHELQWYVQPDYEPTSGVDPFSVEDGVLTITAQAASEEIAAEIGHDYTSGLLTTYDTFAQTYGYFEIRADMPDNDGVWPAFWLMPADQTWPPELDVIEMVGQDPNELVLTAHTNETGSHVELGSFAYVPDTSGFHTYGLLWTEEELVWYFDDVEVARTATPADMHEDMYMIVNLAVGGVAGEPDDGLATPAEMQVDHVRAYSLDAVAGDFAI